MRQGKMSRAEWESNPLRQTTGSPVQRESEREDKFIKGEGDKTTYMVRYLNYMVQFLRFQSDTTNNDVRNILLNIRKKCLLV